MGKMKELSLVSEHDIQNGIIELIQYRQGIAIRVNSGFMKVEDRDGKTRVFRGAKAGTSDIIALFLGHFLAIEVKRPGEKATTEQLAFGQQVVGAGGHFLVADNVEAVNELLESIVRIESGQGFGLRVCGECGTVMIAEMIDGEKWWGCPKCGESERG